MMNSWKETFRNNKGCTIASIVTLFAVLVVSVFSLITDTVVVIDDGDTPCIDSVCYDASFYLSAEPFDGSVSLGKLKKVGTGKIYQKVSGGREIDDVEAIIAEEPDLSGIVDSEHEMHWSYVYGVGTTRTVIGYLVAKSGGKEILEVPEAPKADKFSYADVNALKAARVSEGDTVKTRGFYYEKDGGAAEYTIVKKSDASYPVAIALDNGLYAQLNISGSVSVKHLGAYGDGSHNDYDAFVKAISISGGNVYVPNGNYNFDGQIITASSMLVMTGESKDGAVITNAGFIAPYGVSLKNLTFDGAAAQKIQTTGARNAVYTLALDVSPAVNTTVSYSNCTFKNLQFASFARESKGGSFTQETVDNCTFSHIGRVGIYHSLTSASVTVTNNYFEEIGGTDIDTGHVSAVYIGDITNNTYVEAQKVIIQNNVFNNLYTKDDLSNTSHEMNANFISVRADSSVISGNYIANLIGYGSDREAIYTKVRDLTITGNTIINGGYGEGYICNKSHVGDSFHTITNNTLSGSYGSGIRVYCSGVISDNIIEISNCTAAITVTTRSDLTNTRSCEIKNNRITVGTSDVYNVAGTTVATETSNKVIRLSSVSFPITLSGNTVSMLTPISQVISCNNVGNYVDISGNTINTNGFTGVPVTISNNADSAAISANCALNVSGNVINVLAGQKAVSIKFTQADDFVSARNLNFIGNSFTFVGDSSRGTALSYASGLANADTINSDGNISNYAIDKTIVSCVASQCNYDESAFASYRINQ